MRPQEKLILQLNAIKTASSDCFTASFIQNSSKDLKESLKFCRVLLNGGTNSPKYRKLSGFFSACLNLEDRIFDVSDFRSVVKDSKLVLSELKNLGWFYKNGYSFSIENNKCPAWFKYVDDTWGLIIENNERYASVFYSEEEQEIASSILDSLHLKYVKIPAQKYLSADGMSWCDDYDVVRVEDILKEWMG